MSVFFITVATNLFAIVPPVPIKEFQEKVYTESCFEKLAPSPCMPNGTVRDQLDFGRFGCKRTKSLPRMDCQNSSAAPLRPPIAAVHFAGSAFRKEAKNSWGSRNGCHVRSPWMVGMRAQ